MKKNRMRIGHKKMQYNDVIQIKNIVIENNIKFDDELLEIAEDCCTSQKAYDKVIKFLNIHEKCGYIDDNGQLFLMPTRHLCKRFSSFINGNKRYGVTK